jgi:hypothetical protein
MHAVSEALPSGCARRIGDRSAGSLTVRPAIAASVTPMGRAATARWSSALPVKYFRCEGLGFRGHFRYKPTMLNDEDAGDFCDPFGFCQGSLQQIEVTAGVVVRF